MSSSPSGLVVKLRFLLPRAHWPRCLDNKHGTRFSSTELPTSLRHHSPSSQTRSKHFFDTHSRGTREMEFTAVLIKMVALISAACSNVEKLPAALVTSGIVEAAAALALTIFKPPAGIFIGHGKAPLYLYYSILVAAIIFGIVEASAGFYVSGDLIRRRAIGMTILWISVLPIVLVAGLGGFVIFKY